MHNSSIAKVFLFGLALAGTTVVCGCSSDAEAPAAPPRDELSYRLQPWTTELPAEVLSALTKNDLETGTLTFSGSPALVRDRAPGDVLVAGKSDQTPKGLLRAVVSVTSDGGDTVVETIPVPLPLAFESLHAKLTRTGIDLAGPNGPNQPKSTTPALSAEAYTVGKTVGDQRVFDTELYNLDKNKDTKDDQFLVHAELQGQVGFTATVDLDWLDASGAIDHAKDCLEKAIKNPLSILSDCVTLPDVKVSFDVSLEGDGLLDVEGAASKEYKSGPIPLSETPWELPDLYAGPVVLTPELDFTANVEGDAANYFHARTEFGYDLGVKAKIGTKSGVSAPDPTFEKKIAKPVVSVSSSGHSKASFGPRLSLLAYDTFGFYTDLHGFGELEADRKSTPCWDYTVGIELTPGIRLRIPWKKFGLKKLADKLGWNWDFGSGVLGSIPLYQDHPFDGAPLSERACTKPPTSALPLGEGPSTDTYESPTFSPWSYRFGNIRAKQPFVPYPGQSHVLVEKTHASSWLVSGTSVGSVMHLADDGSVVWARGIDVGLLPDEAALALDPSAESALALTSDPVDFFVASDRLTLLALDYDGNVTWAKRLRLESGLPGPELRELSPVAMTRMKDGDFSVLYSRHAVDHVGSELVLLRVSPNGTLRFARRFAFPTGQLSLGSNLVPIGDDVVVTGLAFEPTETASYLARFDDKGTLEHAERVNACGSSRVRIESATLRASGDLALFGTHEISPERTFFATVSPDGVPRGATALWSGSILQDLAGAAVAELPTSGFVSLGRWTPWVGSALELSTLDSQGQRTGGRGYALSDQSASNMAALLPAALRLTTDGGALVVAHVEGDHDFSDQGLWITKLPAKTFDAPFDPAFVETGPDTFPAESCTVNLIPAQVEVHDLALDALDVTDVVSAVPLTPTREARTTK
jgi:hypothetical protein